MTGPTLRDPGVIDATDLEPVDVPACAELDGPRNHDADDDDTRRLACARAAAAKPRRSWLTKRGAR